MTHARALYSNILGFNHQIMENIFRKPVHLCELKVIKLNSY